jgi:hypothetical protein
VQVGNRRHLSTYLAPTAPAQHLQHPQHLLSTYSTHSTCSAPTAPAQHLQHPQYLLSTYSTYSALIAPIQHLLSTYRAYLALFNIKIQSSGMKMLHKKTILFSIIEKTTSNMHTTMEIISFKKNTSEYITVSNETRKKIF